MTIWKKLLDMANNVVSYGMSLVGNPISADGLYELEEKIYKGKFQEIPKLMEQEFLPEIGNIVHGEFKPLMRNLIVRLGSTITEAVGMPLPEDVIRSVATAIVPEPKKTKKVPSKDSKKETKKSVPRKRVMNSKEYQNEFIKISNRALLAFKNVNRSY